MKSVVIMQGVSGSGKSTHVRRMVASLPPSVEYQVCSADDFFGPDYNFDPAKLGEAHATCLLTFLGALQQKYQVVYVDNTNCGAIEIAPYMALAQAMGYEVRIVRVACELDVAVERAEKGKHKTPAKAVIGQWKQLKCYDPPPWWPQVEVWSQD